MYIAKLVYKVVIWVFRGLFYEKRRKLEQLQDPLWIRR